MVFGAREVQALEGGTLTSREPFPVAHLCVLHKDNPCITMMQAQMNDGTSS